MADVLWASFSLWKYFCLVHEILPNLVLAKTDHPVVSVLDFECDSQSAMAKYKYKFSMIINLVLLHVKICTSYSVFTV